MICFQCEEDKDVSEFGRTNGEVKATCKKCSNLQHAIRVRKAKRKYVELKGGKCVRCGYDKCLGALDFHHRNSDEKEFNPGDLIKGVKDHELIMNELDKCDLVCSNCHREIHHEIETRKLEE